MSIRFASILACAILVSRSAFAEPPPERKEDPDFYAAADVPFADEHIREIFLAVDAAARSLAKPHWETSKDAKYVGKLTAGNAYKTYKAYWSLKQDDSAPKQGITTHSILIEFTVTDFKNRATGFHMMAMANHANGWGASCFLNCYAASDGRKEWATAAAGHKQNAQRDANRATLAPHWSFGERIGWSELHSAGLITYQFSGYPEPKQPGFGPPLSKLKKSQTIFASAESLRDQTFDELDRQEAGLKAAIKSGVGLGVHNMHRGNQDSFDPNDHAKFTAEIRDMLHSRALQRTELTRATIKEQYRELYDAILMPFPEIKELVKKLKE